MAYEMQVVFKGDHVEAFSKGDKSYQTALQLWTEINRLCRQHDCYKVLGIAESTRQMSVMDSMNHQNLFQDLGITKKYKIAWVELNPSQLPALRDLETILINRGFSGKAFADIDAAKAWLLADAPTK